MPETEPKLARRLGLFDATMIVMGGIIGSGIFINPYVVARQVTTPFLILGVWAAGGLIALAAAFIWAELAALRPEVGGQYAYLREAYHPLIAFLYGWGLLLVIQTGGMAAVAVTFARYFLELTSLRVADKVIAALALAALTVINCLGVRAGSSVQSLLMVLKILAILALIVCGLWIVGLVGPQPTNEATATAGVGGAGFVLSSGFLPTIGAAMVPVLFAYGGWQTSTFVAGEIREPQKNLPRALIIGVTGVVILYLAVNFVYVSALGVSGLANTTTPASDVMRLALGQTGARLIAAGIAISTLGFLSQGMLTAPRVYFAMAEDRLFFRSVGKLNPRTQVPVVAIVLQGLFAIAIALWGKYEQILNYVVSVDFIFFGATAACIFVFRRRTRRSGVIATEEPRSFTRVPGHPLTTGLFVAVCWLVVINTVYKYPENTLIGLAILLAGIPAFYFLAGEEQTMKAASLLHHTKQSEYMHWAKTRSDARFNLATSGLANLSLKDLRVSLDDLEITGTSGYGYEPLIRALAGRYQIDSGCVVTAAGTSFANHLAMAALINPGDEVLFERPVYEPLLALAHYLRADVKRFDRQFEDGFRLLPAEIEKKISNRTRLIVITNFHNPSGVFTDDDTLAEVGEIARKVNARVLVDEVYVQMLFEEPPRTAFHLGHQFVVTSSLTKAFGLSGLRCGWIFAEAELAERMWRLNDLFAASPVHVGERLSVLALQQLEGFSKRAQKRLNENREILNRFLDQRQDLEAIRPGAGSIMFPRVKQGDSEMLCRLLREKYETSVVPGRFFEMPAHFRIGLGGDTETLTEGLRQLGAALDEVG